MKTGWCFEIQLLSSEPPSPVIPSSNQATIGVGAKVQYRLQGELKLRRRMIGSPIGVGDDGGRVLRVRFIICVDSVLWPRIQKTFIFRYTGKQVKGNDEIDDAYEFQKKNAQKIHAAAICRGICVRGWVWAAWQLLLINQPRGHQYAAHHYIRP